ncbi:hypothetical protein Tco_1367531 [Tanacetum coccineum]
MNMNMGRQMHIIVVNLRNQGNRQTHNARNHLVGNNAGQNRNKIVRNPQGHVATLVIGNNGTWQNANQIRCYNYRGISLTARHHVFLSNTSDEEREEGELTANYLFVTKFQPASSNMDTASVYDSDGISKALNFDHYYDNEMYNLFTHKEQHLELPESTQVTLVHYKSLEKEADESLDKVKVLEKENDRLLEAILFSDVMFTILHNSDNICKNKPSELENTNQESEIIALQKKISKILKQAVDVKADFSKRLFVLQRNFDNLEKHKISLEIQLQNQSLTSGIKHSVAKFFKENEDLNKQNEILKRHYQDLYKSIKRTQAQNIEKTTFLIAQLNSNTVENADSTTKLNDKTFAYAKLQKIMKGNNVNTNFAKPSILGKPHSSKPSISSSLPKSMFAPQVDEKMFLSKPVTTHFLPKQTENAVKNSNMIAPGMYIIDSRM